MQFDAQCRLILIWNNDDPAGSIDNISRATIALTFHRSQRRIFAAKGIALLIVDPFIVYPWYQDGTERKTSGHNCVWRKTRGIAKALSED